MVHRPFGGPEVLYFPREKRKRAALLGGGGPPSNGVRRVVESGRSGEKPSKAGFRMLARRRAGGYPGVVSPRGLEQVAPPWFVKASFVPTATATASVVAADVAQGQSG